jgi:hypothetical protein
MRAIVSPNQTELFRWEALIFRFYITKHVYDMGQIHQDAMLDGGETTEYTFLVFSPDSQFLASSTCDGMQI